MATNAEYMIAGTIAKTLREELASMVQYVLEEEADPVTTGIVTNSSRVSSTLGRRFDASRTTAGDFTAQHPLVFGRAGTIKYATASSLLGEDVPTGGTSAEAAPYLLATPTYPSATAVPQRRTEWLSIGLKRLMGNLVIDDRQLMALEKGMPVDDFFVQWLKDPAEILRTQLTTDFFGNNSLDITTGKVGTVTAVSILTDTNSYAAGSKTLLTLTAGTDTLRSFWRGMRLNATDGTTGHVFGSTTLGVWTVQSVYAGNATDGTAPIQIMVICTTPPAGGSYAATDFTADDTLHLEGALATGAGSAVSGLGNMLVDPGATTGNVLDYYGLPLYSATTGWIHPELQSYWDVPTTDRFPTPLLFAKAMGIMADRGLGMPKRWIMGRGVRDLWFQQESMFKAYNTNLGPAVQSGADGGYSGQLSITTIDGGKAEVVCSAFCPGDTAFGIDMDAFVRYAPFGTDAVKFLGSNRLTGNQSFLMTVNGEGDYTSIYQQPFDYWTEWGCTAPWKLAKIGALKMITDVI